MNTQVYFDLDRVLYNTSAHLEEVNNFLMARGYERHEIERARLELHDRGYSFSKHLKLLGEPENRINSAIAQLSELSASGRHVFPGVIDGLGKLRASGITLNLLSFGVPKHQRGKWAGLLTLHEYFDQTFFVNKRETKGQILARETSRGQAVYFIDDAPNWLMDSLNFAPWVNRIRLMWPECHPAAHPADGSLWQAANNFEEVLEIVSQNHSC